MERQLANGAIALIEWGQHVLARWERGRTEHVTSKPTPTGNTIWGRYHRTFDNAYTDPRVRAGKTNHTASPHEASYTKGRKNHDHIGELIREWQDNPDTLSEYDVDRLSQWIIACRS